MTFDDVATSRTSPRVPPGDNSRADVVTGRNPDMEVLPGLARRGAGADTPPRAARARTRASRRPGRKQPGHGRNSPRSKPKNDFHCVFNLTFSMPLVVLNRDLSAIQHNVLTK